MTIVEKYHEYIKGLPKKHKAIDATCGNGHDTLFLATLYDKVIGIDIQNLAIKRTIEKTKDIENISIYKDDFNRIDNYGACDLVVFNLGFLPGSNKKIKTQDYTSSKAILKATNISDTVIVACYTKHEGGILEYNNLICELKNNNLSFTSERFESEDILIIITKNGTL